MTNWTMLLKVSCQYPTEIHPPQPPTSTVSLYSRKLHPDAAQPVVRSMALQPTCSTEDVLMSPLSPAPLRCMLLHLLLLRLLLHHQFHRLRQPLLPAVSSQDKPPVFTSKPPSLFLDLLLKFDGHLKARNTSAQLKVSLMMVYPGLSMTTEM